MTNNRTSPPNFFIFSPTPGRRHAGAGALGERQIQSMERGEGGGEEDKNGFKWKV